MNITAPTLLPALLAGFFLTGCTGEVPRMALGTLEQDRITLSATAGEIITAEPVSEGATVQAGDLLVQLDDTLQQAAIRRTEAEIAAQQALLEKLQNGPRPQEIAAARARGETAEATLLESERDLTRIREIVQRNLGAQADLDTAEIRRDSNAARLRDARAQLDLLLAGSRAEDIAQASAQLAALNASLQAQQQQLRNLSVVATRAGKLDSLPWHVGERVTPGSQVAIILADGPPYARVYIPEPARAAINIGTTLPIYVDGIETPFTGTVRWISLEPAFTPYYALNSSERSRLVYLAEIQLPASAADLPAGLPAQAALP
jgi:HlyD family secretion protein